VTKIVREWETHAHAGMVVAVKNTFASSLQNV